MPNVTKPNVIEKLVASVLVLLLPWQQQRAVTLNPVRLVLSSR